MMQDRLVLACCAEPLSLARVIDRLDMHAKMRGGFFGVNHPAGAAVGMVFFVVTIHTPHTFRRRQHQVVNDAAAARAAAWARRPRAA